MAKTRKLIALLTVLALLAGTMAAALADDRIFTSEAFSVPKERIDPLMLEQALNGQTADPEAEAASGTEEPVTESQENPEEAPAPEEKPEEVPVQEEKPEEVPAQAEKEEETPAQRQVLIFSSRKETVVRGELITLTSTLIGFDGVTVHYQWQVDRGDGNGWVDVQGANGATHEFRATEETILYAWRLNITVDE